MSNPFAPAFAYDAMQADHSHCYDPNASGVNWVRLPQPGAVTLLDYFAARAPEQPQPWFKPTMPEPKPELQYFSPQGEPITAKKADEFQDECTSNWEEREAWDKEHKKQCFVQWPYAWAQEQMKVRQQLMSTTK